MSIGTHDFMTADFPIPDEINPEQDGDAFGCLIAEPGGIAAGTRKVRDKPARDRIGNVGEYDRYRPGLPEQRDQGRPAPTQDHVGPKAD